MHSSSVLKLLPFLTFMSGRSFAIVSNEYLDPQDAASGSNFLSLAADEPNNENLIGTSEVGVMTDSIKHQLEKQALLPPSIKAGENSASLMQLSDGQIDQCTTSTNQFPNSRRRVKRGELCPSNLGFTPDNTKKDPNLRTTPTRQEVESANGQRGNIEEGSPSNGRKPSSEQERNPTSQSAEQKTVEPSKGLCSDKTFKYAVCGPYLWAEQSGSPYRRRWDLEGCNPCK